MDCLYPQFLARCLAPGLHSGMSAKAGGPTPLTLAPFPCIPLIPLMRAKDIAELKLLGVTEKMTFSAPQRCWRGNVEDRNPKLSVYNFEPGLEAGRRETAVIGYRHHIKNQ